MVDLFFKLLMKKSHRYATFLTKNESINCKVYPK